MHKTEIGIEEHDADKKIEEQEFSNRSGHGTGEPSSVSAVIQKIWQDVLRVSHVDPSDDFFDLGGDSLMAIRMLVSIDREYGEELLEPDIIYKASRLDDFTNAVMDALAQRAPK